jgi:hypothetical protein
MLVLTKECTFACRRRDDNKLMAFKGYRAFLDRAPHEHRRVPFAMYALADVVMTFSKENYPFGMQLAPRESLLVTYCDRAAQVCC